MKKTDAPIIKEHKPSIPQLQVTDICEIMRMCAQCGVREFSFRGLLLSFGQQMLAPTIEPIYVPTQIQEKSDSQAREAIARQELRIKDDLVQSLLLEDPEGYEQLLRDGELTNEERD